jgi:hypothetical protein
MVLYPSFFCQYEEILAQPPVGIQALVKKKRELSLLSLGNAVSSHKGV